MSSDVIFEPLKWRNIEIKNKIFRSSISGRWDNEDGSLTQVRVNWESRFAQGGVAKVGEAVHKFDCTRCEASRGRAPNLHGAMRLLSRFSRV